MSSPVCGVNTFVNESFSHRMLRLDKTAKELNTFSFEIICRRHRLRVFANYIVHEQSCLVLSVSAVRTRHNCCVCGSDRNAAVAMSTLVTRNGVMSQLNLDSSIDKLLPSNYQELCKLLNIHDIWKDLACVVQNRNKTAPRFTHDDIL